MNIPPTPRAYLACLASYNAGRLRGVWVDLDVDAEDIRDAAAALLAATGGEEIAVHDYDACPSGILGETYDPDRLARLGEILTGPDRSAFLAAVSVFGAGDWELGGVMAGDMDPSEAVDVRWGDSPDEIAEEMAEEEILTAGLHLPGEWGSTSPLRDVADLPLPLRRLDLAAIRRDYEHDGWTWGTLDGDDFAIRACW